MMKAKAKWTVAAALLAAGFSGSAAATPWTWTDVIDFRPDKLVTTHNPVLYSHVLEDFKPFQDDVQSYSLTFDLFDDKDSGSEKAIAFQLGDWDGTTFFNLSGTEKTGWTIEGRLQIELTGALTVLIGSLTGDFYLGGSTLVVKGDKKSRTSVPEPTTLGLLGTALLGFGLMRRRKQAL